jgi:hypothetical protein
MAELRGGPVLSPVTSRCVLLVEGDDEKRFFEALVKHMGLQVGQDIEFRRVEGTGNFKAQFQAFLNDPGFNHVTAYGLIRDADDSAQRALTKLQGILRSFGHPCPTAHATFAYDATNMLKVGIFIMPGKMSQGMLEDLCLESVQNHAIMPFVDEYTFRVKQTMKADAPKNESKAKMQTFLAGMKECVPHLGIAAGKGYWNFDSAALDELRAFILELTRHF